MTRWTCGVRSGPAMISGLIQLVVHGLFPKGPFLTTYRAGLLFIAAGTGRQPLRDALQMKGVPALAKDHGAIFSRILDVGRRSFKGSLTNTAHFIIHVPGPTGNGVKPFDAELESRRGSRLGRVVRDLHGCVAGSLGHFASAV